MLSAVVRSPSACPLAPASNAAGRSSAVRMSWTSSFTPRERAASSSSLTWGAAIGSTRYESTSTREIQDHEELVAGVSGACEHRLGRRFKDLRDPRDVAELPTRAILKQGHALRALDLQVLLQMEAREHGTRQHPFDIVGCHEPADEFHDALRLRRVPAYSMTSSARSSSDCGMVRPSAFAVFILMINSNFVGCSMGRSAGFAPLRILST